MHLYRNIIQQKISQKTTASFGPLLRPPAWKRNIQIHRSSTPAYLARHIRSRQISRRLRSCTNLLPELSLLTVLSVVQCGIRLAMSLSLALHLPYLSLPLRHSYSVRHLGLVCSLDRNPSVSASGVFDIMAQYKTDYYYYQSINQSINQSVNNRMPKR